MRRKVVCEAVADGVVGDIEGLFEGSRAYTKDCIIAPTAKQEDIKSVFEGCKLVSSSMLSNVDVYGRLWRSGNLCVYTLQDNNSEDGLSFVHVFVLKAGARIYEGYVFAVKYLCDYCEVHNDSVVLSFKNTEDTVELRLRHGILSFNSLGDYVTSMGGSGSHYYRMNVEIGFAEDVIETGIDGNTYYFSGSIEDFEKFLVLGYTVRLRHCGFEYLVAYVEQEDGVAGYPVEISLMED